MPATYRAIAAEDHIMLPSDVCEAATPRHALDHASAELQRWQYIDGQIRQGELQLAIGGSGQLQCERRASLWQAGPAQALHTVAWVDVVLAPSALPRNDSTAALAMVVTVRSASARQTWRVEGGELEYDAAPGWVLAVDMASQLHLTPRRSHFTAAQQQWVVTAQGFVESAVDSSLVLAAAPDDNAVRLALKVHNDAHQKWRLVHACT